MGSATLLHFQTVVSHHWEAFEKSQSQDEIQTAVFFKVLQIILVFSQEGDFFLYWSIADVQLLYKLQVCNIVIHNFLSLHSTDKVLAIFPVLYSYCVVFLQLVLYIVVYTSYSPTPILPLPSSLSPLVTTSSFSIPVSLFLFCYIY